MSALRSSLRFFPVGIALLCVQLDFFSLGLAMPTIAKGLGYQVTDLQWLVSAYLLAIGAFTIPAGRIGDLVGRRRTLIVGLALFAVTSLICGLSTELVPLVISRAVQGIGAALIIPNAFALISNDTTPRERPEVVGAMIGLSGVGTALGPVVGGVFASTVGWQWVFWINVPLAVVAILGSLRVHESRNDAIDRSLASIDWWGAITVMLGLTLLSLGIDNIGPYGWRSVLTWGLMIAGIAGLVVFALVERRAANPLVHPRLLRNRPYVALIAVGTIGNMGVNIFILMATFDLQVIRGFPAQQAGLLFVSGSVGVALSGPVGGWLCARFPATRVLAFATIVGAGGLTLISTASILPVYLAALALAGLACGMAYSVTQIGVQSVVPPQQSGEATSFMLMPLIALGGLAVVITSGIVEQIGGGTPTAGGVSVVLLGSAAVMAVAGAALLLGERLGLLHETDATASAPGTPD